MHRRTRLAAVALAVVAPLTVTACGDGDLGPNDDEQQQDGVSEPGDGDAGVQDDPGDGE